ncbi:unnamed protein product [Clonostachys solani]|uniref:Major facilitator superfamily (MFS) profile domain-containing protein n=1 Tax=Clonostachys solani TaxID=160281 RepID=A0A9P0EQF6_9HYPO|nr:unnamed protein product [Clonostachys solani]
MSAADRSTEEKVGSPDDLIRTASGSGKGTSETSVSPEKQDDQDQTVILSKYETSWVHRLLTPPNCRWDPSVPHELTYSLCILYATAASFTVANLYYNQSILNKIAETFGVSYETSSQVPTLMQAGYASGLIFVLPLGDILERRFFIIGLVSFTAIMWIGLCVTNNFTAFRAISFICGMTTVTPQLMVPLVGDYAPPNRKATSLSIVSSGLMLGILIARLLAGVVANYTAWRNIYWLGCAIQFLLAILLFAFFPDYPSTNPDGLNYFKALWTVIHMMLTEPLLIQSGLMAFCISGVFTSFWTTLTFLLASPPFEYSSLQIGLFSLLILVIVIVIPALGPFMDRYEPLLPLLCCGAITMIGVIIGTFTGTFSIAGPIIQAICIDIGHQMGAIVNRTAIFTINPKARNRLNTAYMACAFAGQLTGSAVGNRLYAQGGWRYSGYCSIGLVTAMILFALARGPHETGWVGWSGGWELRKVRPSKVEQRSDGEQTA